ncbi:hypothetical protein DL93DRAFT_2080139 [Clavulina sp. PMI_390]|nr:hypothetical protein DL93DRAFT_2080139 [Clavulina sp. PMI_390]
MEFQTHSSRLVDLDLELGAVALVVPAVTKPTTIKSKSAAFPLDDLAIVEQSSPISPPAPAYISEQTIAPPSFQQWQSFHSSIRRRHRLTGKALPSKPNRWIQLQWFMTTYRKFFIFIVTLNLAAITSAATGHFLYGRTHSGAILLGNLLAAVLMRNEFFLRILYFLANHLLAKWPPLWLRLTVTSTLQHVGGIHSGCATSGLMWILYKVISLLRDRRITATPVLTMGIITSLCIIISVISAFPWIRQAHHNAFERHHRFIGWLGIAATWIFVFLGDCYDSITRVCEIHATTMIRDQQFWFVLVMTIIIIIPWAFTRRVSVEVEVPSKKVAIIKFKRGIQQGMLGRISLTSVLEYHTFGIISQGICAESHYMVCGVQGDFTKSLVENPPKYLWTREIKCPVVSNTSKMYRRGIRICTGTGIGAGLSTCLQSDQWFLIWIGSDQIATFGTTVHDLIVNNIPPERRILWDSKKLGGRPDVMNLLEETYRKWNAEVVFITSNDQGNREIMLGCKERGIPSFGTLFDF